MNPDALATSAASGRHAPPGTRPADSRPLRPRAAELEFNQSVPYRAVFDYLPVGLVLCDADGCVTAANALAGSLLGEALTAERVRCCDVFGCRREGTPLSDHCLTELAQARPGRMPEVRVDTSPQPDVPGSAWITAAPLGGADAAIVITLRPGQVGDRRRRTEPHWMGGLKLRLFTLGRTRLESEEGPLAGEWLSHRPGELLKYLVCERRRVVPVEDLLEVFWPTVGRTGTTNVRQAIHTLRHRLEPRRAKHGPSSFVLARKGGYELDEANVWIDADDFEASARAGLTAAQRGDAQHAEPALTRAAALYRGDFLADEPYAEWAFAERDRLRDLAAQVLRAHASIRLAAGELDGAAEQLNRVAELEPFDMGTQRDLLALMLRRGRRSEAHRRYEIVRRRYRKAFGEDPDFVLADLAERAPG